MDLKRVLNSDQMKFYFGCRGSGLKSQSFMDMIRSAKGTSQDDDLDDEDDFVMKKESSSTSQIHRGLNSIRYHQRDIF